MKKEKKMKMIKVCSMFFIFRILIFFSIKCYIKLFNSITYDFFVPNLI